MTLPVFRKCAAAILMASLLPESASLAAGDSLTISLSLFSGRPRPRAVLSESSLVAPVVAALESRLKNPLPYSMVPGMPSTPNYTGMFLRRGSNGPQSPSFLVREGWICTTETQPCYRDSGSVLEKLGVSAAFTQDDLDYPGGPRPMFYLACLVPDSLHPDVTCASTGLRPRSPQAAFTAPAFFPLPGFDVAGRKRYR